MASDHGLTEEVEDEVQEMVEDGLIQEHQTTGGQTGWVLTSKGKAAVAADLHHGEGILQRLLDIAKENHEWPPYGRRR